MNAVIGLFRGEAQASRSIGSLREIGLGEGDIRLLSQEDAIRKLLGCAPTCIVPTYAVWGALIGVAIYAIFGLAAARCQCNLLGLRGVFGVGAFIGAVLAGAFVGGFLGFILGFAEFEEDSHLYVQGVRLGGRVIVVQAGEGEAEKVKRLLEGENASGVRTIEHGRS
jgi:hypothetical protein